MGSAEYFQFPVYTGTVLSCICFWLLIRKFKKTLNYSEFLAPGGDLQYLNGWKLLKLLFAFFPWFWANRETKLPILEELGSQLNKISFFGRPKFFRIFNFNIIINDDFKSALNVITSRKDVNRFPVALNEALSNGKPDRGILWNCGPIWKELRKYTIKKLGQLGFGKSDKLSFILSDLVPDLLNHLENIKEKTDNKIPIKNVFSLHVINVVWCTVGGKKFLEGDETFARLYENLNTVTSFPMLNAYFGTFLPNNKFTRTVFRFDKAYQSVINLHDYFSEFVEEKIKLSKEKAELEDFVDYFLFEIEKYKDNEDMNKIYNTVQLSQVLGELFVAGLDTTSKYLELFLMYMILNPEVQRKLQEEIDLIVPGNITPSYSDHRQSMPYMCAAMMEAHRMGNVIPIFARYVPNYFNDLARVPGEGAQIISNMWAVRYDVSYWGDPYIFRPERFLNGDNTFITEKMNQVMPFGAGSRSCPGENVSTASSFAFLVTILKKYSIRKAFGNEFVGIEKTCGSVTQTNAFHMALEER